MVQVGIRALKARLNEFGRRAAAGETIVVTERGRPVAELVRHRSTVLPGRLAESAQRGEVSLATKPPRVPKVRARTPAWVFGLGCPDRGTAARAPISTV